MTRSLASLSDPSPDTAPILIFQMAKVASRSWRRLLESTFSDREIENFHVISPKTVDMMSAVQTAQGPQQTMKYVDGLDLGRAAPSLEKYFKDGVWIGPPVDIVTGVRDPVARAVSAVGHMSNRVGYSRLPVTVRDGGTPANLNALFKTVLRAAREGADGSDTFVYFLSHMITHYRTWFQEELAPAFGADASAIPFNHAERHMLIEGRNRVLLYRVEDLADKEASALVQRAASSFFGREVGAVQPEDESREQRYKAFYREFVRTIRLTSDELDFFYEHPMVTDFYSLEEIGAFRRRWSGG